MLVRSVHLSLDPIYMGVWTVCVQFPKDSPVTSGSVKTGQYKYLFRVSVESVSASPTGNPRPDPTWFYHFPTPVLLPS